MRPRRGSKVGRGNSKVQRRHKPDYILIIIASLLMVVGLIVVYAISPGLAAHNNVSNNYYVSKQLLAISMGVITFIAVSKVPLHAWQRIKWPLVIITIVASFAVRFLGERVNGAYRWIQVGGFSFQPVELLKFTLIILLAAFLADRISKGKHLDFHSTIKPIAIMLGIITIVVALMQSDLGSAGVLVAITGLMAFIAGLPMKKLMVGFIVVLGLAFVLIGSVDYRRERFMTFLNPERDCMGAGYQTCQALIAVGSGGLVGRGLANSGQAFGYLPEAANDSIFAIMAEKFGFVGISILLVLYGLLFSRIKYIMAHSANTYHRLIVAGVLAWLSTQAFINIGAMLGLLPLKGITLPFISYGGTSVVFVLAAVGLVFNISRYTSFEVNFDDERSQSESTSNWRGNRRSYNTVASRR